MILAYKEKTPVISDGCFIADNASVIGDVEIGRLSSVWFGAVIRGDEDSITIGENSNVQDNAVLHCNIGHPIKVGNNVTIGHNAIVHGAVIEDNALVGMGAIVMDGAVVGKNAVIGAGAVCTENMLVPDGAVVVGIPGKIIKYAGESNSDMNVLNATAYVQLAEDYLSGK